MQSLLAGGDEASLAHYGCKVCFARFGCLQGFMCEAAASARIVLCMRASAADQVSEPRGLLQELMLAFRVFVFAAVQLVTGVLSAVRESSVAVGIDGIHGLITGMHWDAIHKVEYEQHMHAHYGVNGAAAHGPSGTTGHGIPSKVKSTLWYHGTEPTKCIPSMRR